MEFAEPRKMNPRIKAELDHMRKEIRPYHPWIDTYLDDLETAAEQKQSP
jgi:hypothetical protein